MKMYKFIGLIAVAGLTLTACTEEETPTAEVPAPQPETEVDNYVYVLGTGVEGLGINGELGIFNATTNTLTDISFSSVNQRSLGLTSNDITVHGNVGVITVRASNTIEVVSLPSLTSIKHIELTGHPYSYPRCVIYAENNYYISMQTGHVVRLNPSTWQIDACASIDALKGASSVNPEGMAYLDGKIYVAMADYDIFDNVKEDRVVVINAQDMSVERCLNVATNLTDIINAGGKLYALSSGDYDENWTPIGAGIYTFNTNGTSQFIAAASYVVLSANNATLYYINAPYGAPTTTLGCINTATNEVSIIAEPAPGVSPTAIAASPDGTSLIIGSNAPGESGWAAYDIPGYLVRYNLTNNQATEIQTNITGINRIVPSQE